MHAGEMPRAGSPGQAGPPGQAATGLHDRFDGLICVDALENTAPEHWPGVSGLAATLRPAAPGCTVLDQAGASDYRHFLLARS